MAANLFSTEAFPNYSNTPFQRNITYYQNNPMPRDITFNERLRNIGNSYSSFLESQNATSPEELLNLAKEKNIVETFDPNKVNQFTGGDVFYLNGFNGKPSNIGFYDGKKGYYFSNPDFGGSIVHVMNTNTPYEGQQAPSYVIKVADREAPPVNQTPNSSLFNPRSPKFFPDNQTQNAELLNLQNQLTAQQPTPRPTMQTIPQNNGEVFDPYSRKFREGIISAKQVYDAATNRLNLVNGMSEEDWAKMFAGNENLAKNGKLTVAGREYVKSYADNLNMTRIDANNQATLLRNSARDIGLNIDGAGEENTLAEAQQKLFAENVATMRNLIDLKPTEIQQREYYELMRERGLSPRLARIAADEQHDLIRANNIQALRNGLAEFGVNEDGSMNAFGMTMINKLAGEDPVAAQLFAGELASPLNVFNEANANYRQGLTLNANRENQNRDLTYRYDALEKTLAAQERARQEEYAHQESMLRLRASLQKAGVPVDNMSREIQQIANNLTGGDMQKATEIYARQHYDKLFETSARDENGNIEMADMQKVKNLVDTRFRFIEYFLEQGNFKDAKESITAYREKLMSDDFKYAEQLDGGSVNYILSALDIYEQVADQKITLEEAHKLLNQGSASPSIADTKKGEYDKYSNEKAKQIGEREAKRQRNKRNKNKREQENVSQRTGEYLNKNWNNWTGYGQAIR